MPTDSVWTNAESIVGQYVTLVLGWKKGKGLRAGWVKLTTDMGEAIRSQALATLATVNSLIQRPYDAGAQLEEDECFTTSVKELPHRPETQALDSLAASHDENSNDPQTEASALIQLLSSPRELEQLNVNDIVEGRFLFYAAVFSGADNAPPMAFVKKHNPARVFRAGNLIGLFGDAISKLEQPVLIFEPDFDMVLYGEDIVALTSTAIPYLFADLEVVTSAVPGLVSSLTTVHRLPLASNTLEALRVACGRRRLLARRLLHLCRQPHLSTLTVDQVAQYLDNLKVDPASFISGNQFVVEEDKVEEFLDILDQRHYIGPYDNQRRRADRVSLVR